MNDPRPYDAVVFDNDGVLTEPTDPARLRRAVETAFAAVGVSDPAPAHVDAVRNARSPETVAAVCDEYGVDPERFWRRHEREAAATQRVALRSGEKRLYDDVAALEGIDLPRGLVSNNQHRTVEYVLSTFDLDGLFDTCYGRFPTPAGMGQRKPDPHYLRLALADLGADSALYVGDSEVDVVAAERAGVDAAYVHRDHRPADYLDRSPTYELDGLLDLPAVLAGEVPPAEPSRV